MKMTTMVARIPQIPQDWCVVGARLRWPLLPHPIFLSLATSVVLLAVYVLLWLPLPLFAVPLHRTLPIPAVFDRLGRVSPCVPKSAWRGLESDSQFGTPRIPAAKDLVAYGP